MKSKSHTKSPGPPKKTKRKHTLAYFLGGSFIGAILVAGALLWHFGATHKDRVYPNVSIAGIPFSGKTAQEVTEYWLSRNAHFDTLNFTFQFEDHVATLSGRQLNIGFDASVSATQALSIGRSGQFSSDLYQKYQALTQGINLQPIFTWNTETLDTTLDSLALQIDIEPESALFEFQNGKVSAFKLAKTGRSLDTETLKRQFVTQLERLSQETNPQKNIVFALPVRTKEPLVQTEQANDLGIIELIGRGESTFRGSIPGRIHNVALAASRINGHLIPPGQTFSFNAALGDISAATGYKQAYVIKQGRTVLDDGGGVCQVSTTLFRAALNSGLPITERHAHSYRVSYYEQGGWKPGFDATVYAPSYDLKIQNDTPSHVLIQAIADTKNLSLTFELYGKKDGRIAEISPTRLWDPRPAPPDLVQDDPTLPTGQMKQVDWANPGIKAAFDYKVTRNGEVLFEKNFFSNFVPWQAVFLKGTGPAQ